MQQIAGAALKVGGALFNAWAGSRAAAKIASKEGEKNRDLLLMNARRRNESALENAENRLQSTHALGVFNNALTRQAGQNAVTGASNSRIAMQRQANNTAMANIAGQQSAAAVARQDKLLDEQSNLVAQGYDAQIKRIQGQRDALQQAGSAAASLGDSLMMGK
jgi:hypothetical protein